MPNPKCPACKTVNLATSTVCRRCGGSLGAVMDAAPAAGSGPSKRSATAAGTKTKPRMGFVIFGGISLFFAITVALFPSWYLTTPEQGRAVSLLLTLIVSVFVQLYGPWPVAGVLSLLGGGLLWIGLHFRVPADSQRQ